MVSYAKSLQQGAGLHQDTQIGPLVSQEQHERVLSYIEKEKRKEPKLSRGGSCPFEEGYFVSPTVFADVDDSMTIAKEEIFGPVLAAIPYDTVDEVIERANRSEYGLAAGLWTENVKTPITLLTVSKPAPFGSTATMFSMRHLLSAAISNPASGGKWALTR